MTKLPYSGVTSSYLHKHHPEKQNYADTKAGLRKVWFLDAQWSTCPVEVQKEVIKLWEEYDLGNDHYMLDLSVNDLLEMKNTEYIVQYIREHNIPDDETVIIHWWW